MSAFTSCGRKQITFETISSDEVYDINIFDINGDNVDDLVYVKHNSVFAIDQQGEFFWQRHFGHNRIDITGFYDIDRDLRKELLCTVDFPDGPHLVPVANHTPRTPGYLIYMKEPGFPKDQRRMEIRYSKMINNGNRQVLVLGLNSGFNIQPRGLLAIDPETGKKLWEHYCGPNVLDLINDDLDGDNIEEIIIQGGATCNGSNANGTDDCHSWIIVVGSDGRCRWRYRFAEGFGRCLARVSDIDLDGNLEVIATYQDVEANSDKKGHIVIIEGRSGRVKKKFIGCSSFWGFDLIDRDHDGRHEIITGNQDGKLRIFDHELRLISEKDFGLCIKVKKVCDLDNDGDYEIICQRGEEILLLNSDLTPIGHFDVGRKHPSCKILKSRQRSKLLVISSSPNMNMCHYTLLDYKLITPLIPASKAAILLAAILTVSLIISLIRLRKKAGYKAILNDLPLGLISIDRKGKIRSVNWKTIEMVGKEGLAIIKERLTEGRPSIEGPIQINDQIIKLEESKWGDDRVLIVTDQTDLVVLDRYRRWAPAAQKIAHQIKNRLSSILLLIQRMGKGTDDKKSFKHAVESIEALRNLSNRFMRLISLEDPKMVETDINRMIKKIIKRFKESYPDIKFLTYLSDSLTVEIDPGQITEVINNLIDNAITAMDGRGEITIETGFFESIEDPMLQFCTISITDNGPGIPEADRNRIFEPFYSTRPSGTGLGLFYVKQVIDAHKGRVEVTSEIGKGTTFTICLPTSGTGLHK